MRHTPLFQLAALTALRFAADDGSGTQSAVALADTSRVLKVGGATLGGDYEFTVKVPYAEGWAINAAEASTLNQTYAENVRNNVAGKIRAAKEAFDKDEANAGQTFSISNELRTELQGYADTYELGVRRTSSAEPVDPVEREARSLAREILSEEFKKAGIKRKDLDEDTYEGALAELARGDDIVKLARKRVADREKIGSGTLDIKALLSGNSGGDAAMGGEGTGDDGGQG